MPPNHCSYYRHRSFEQFAEGTPHEIVWKNPWMVLIRKSKAATE